MELLNRREVLAVAAAACVCSVAGPAALWADDPATQPTSQPSTLDVGAKTDYATDGITSTWLTTNKVAIIRNNNKLYASTGVCTHRGCTVRAPGATTEPDRPYAFRCPCHGATYDMDGKVTKGPARKSLARFAISVDSSGHVIVDMSQTFPDTDWDNPASFVAVS
jgi:cytochrome b6-f complex iron-sulfur subunit